MVLMTSFATFYFDVAGRCIHIRNNGCIASFHFKLLVTISMTFVVVIIVTIIVVFVMTIAIFIFMVVAIVVRLSAQVESNLVRIRINEAIFINLYMLGNTNAGIVSKSHLRQSIIRTFTHFQLFNINYRAGKSYHTTFFNIDVSESSTRQGYIRALTNLQVLIVTT